MKQVKNFCVFAAALGMIFGGIGCRIQKRLFGRAAQGSKMERAAAPVSLLVTILAVTGILGQGFRPSSAGVPRTSGKFPGFR